MPFTRLDCSVQQSSRQSPSTTYTLSFSTWSGERWSSLHLLYIPSPWRVVVLFFPLSFFFRFFLRRRRDTPYLSCTDRNTESCAARCFATHCLSLRCAMMWDFTHSVCLSTNQNDNKQLFGFFSLCRPDDPSPTRRNVVPKEFLGRKWTEHVFLLFNYIDYRLFVFVPLASPLPWWLVNRESI